MTGPSRPGRAGRAGPGRRAARRAGEVTGARPSGFFSGAPHHRRRRRGPGRDRAGGPGDSLRCRPGRPNPAGQARPRPAAALPSGCPQEVARRVLAKKASRQVGCMGDGRMGRAGGRGGGGTPAACRALPKVPRAPQRDGGPTAAGAAGGHSARPPHALVHLSDLRAPSWIRNSREEEGGERKASLLPPPGRPRQSFGPVPRAATRRCWVD